MKNFIFVLLLAALAVSLFTPEIKAADTLKVPLTLNGDKIETNIQTPMLSRVSLFSFILTVMKHLMLQSLTTINSSILTVM